MTYVGHGDMPRDSYRGSSGQGGWTPPHQDAAGPPDWGGSSIELRNLVVDRMRQMNAMHGMHAYDRCRSRAPIGPHGLAFLYRDLVAGGERPRYVLRTATRLFVDGDDVRHLYHLIDELIAIARDYSARGTFDPRITMSNRGDKMSAHAEYVGVGISTLDTRHGKWEEVQQRVSSPLDVPGLCYAVLTDGSRIVVERGAGTIGATRIYSTHPLTDPTNPVRMWTWLRDPDANGLRTLWQWLGALHNLVLEGQTAVMR